MILIAQLMFRDNSVTQLLSVDLLIEGKWKKVLPEGEICTAILSV